MAKGATLAYTQRVSEVKKQNEIKIQARMAYNEDQHLGRFIYRIIKGFDKPTTRQIWRALSDAPPGREFKFQEVLRELDWLHEKGYIEFETQVFYPNLERVEYKVWKVR